PHSDRTTTTHLGAVNKYEVEWCAVEILDSRRGLRTTDDLARPPSGSRKNLRQLSHGRHSELEGNEYDQRTLGTLQAATNLRYYHSTNQTTRQVIFHLPPALILDALRILQ
ncbi:MAG TPA: hypothetical protein PKD64_14010, partial [Pirellulaceae bacterium]|nr:hypothetical protein [Pirellulaceae bacterium]HMO93302.1 hypothetical protein [Pirellulaceae bacterium]HMP69158.1 hypothetical protein [Pirellulaceae bacterium]